MKLAIRFAFAVVSLLLPASFAYAAAGTLFLDPSGRTYTVGQTFELDVYIDTGSASASAAEAELGFDPAMLAVDHIATSTSILGSWASPPSFSNTAGSISFTGWTTNNYAGSKGTLLNIFFTARKAGATDVHFASGTVLAAGEADSNIVSDMRAANVLIVAPQTASAIAALSPADSAMGPPPSAPVLTPPAGNTHAGQSLVLSGSAEPNMKVYLWVQHDQDAPVSIPLLADGDGGFTYMSDSPASAGVYGFWAQAEANDELKSALSQKITVSVGTQGLAAAALSANVPGGVSLTLAILAAVLAGAGYLYYRTR